MGGWFARFQALPVPFLARQIRSSTLFRVRLF
ncbi:hypothetical protein CCHR01_11308 [Colletotrichum chrysophilum]|uniref:Uncharacterized protein n=1 Tax=Colletotrichum chrysophilum TaxID=1836956 RepID=A0AAD9EFU9_9PEZI|nr:hypothetical protein CCHR01_11308 [Colletotrichum chrysophilum]